MHEPPRPSPPPVFPSADHLKWAGRCWREMSASRAVCWLCVALLLAPSLLVSWVVVVATLLHRASPAASPAQNASAIRSTGCGRERDVAAGQLLYRTLSVSGLQREYLLWLPRTYDAERAYPLLLSLHGATNSPVTQAMQDQLHCLADAAPYIVAWPAGYYLDSSAQYSSWNAPGSTARGDSPELGAPCIVDPSTGERRCHRVRCKRGGASVVVRPATCPFTLRSAGPHSMQVAALPRPLH